VSETGLYGVFSHSAQTGDVSYRRENAHAVFAVKGRADALSDAHYPDGWVVRWIWVSGDAS
jgi:hypothetical protein